MEGPEIKFAEAVLDNTLSLVATLCTTDEVLAVWRDRIGPQISQHG